MSSTKITQREIGMESELPATEISIHILLLSVDCNQMSSFRLCVDCNFGELHKQREFRR